MAEGMGVNSFIGLGHKRRRSNRRNFHDREGLGVGTGEGSKPTVGQRERSMVIKQWDVMPLFRLAQRPPWNFWTGTTYDRLQPPEQHHF
jgi:hypothetical protein